MFSEIDSKFMQMALDLAREAASKDEVPVGAVVCLNDKVIAKAHNLKVTNDCATAHAEILAIAGASQKLKRWRLSDCTMYVTLEPCVMCAGALVGARIGKVIYGARDSKAGGVNSLYTILSDSRLNHQVEILSGLLGKECSSVLKEFFRKKR